MTMNKYWIAAAGLTLAIAVPLSSFAQARHDEKPHGMTQASQEAVHHARPATGGRHDEGMTTHGRGRPAAKKDSRESDGSSAGKQGA